VAPVVAGALRSDPSPDRPSAAAASPRPHFPCLEGIRAIAASMVVVHHASGVVGRSQSGYVQTPALVMDMGVAIFFVLSGFLIYRPFVHAHLEGERPQRTRSFLWRRFLRIVPAYWAAFTILWATGSITVNGAWWRYYLFAQVYDVYQVLSGIIPAWSLNVEMIFYLFIPVWAMLLRRLARDRDRALRLQVAGVIVLFAAGYLSRALFSTSDRVWAHLPNGSTVLMREVSFAWFPNQVDLFAAGMALAVLSVAAASRPELRTRLDRIAQPALAWWGAAVALIAWFAYRVGPPEGNGGYHGWYWEERQLFFAVIALCMLVPAAFGDQSRSVVRRTLRLRPVVYLGVVSYGIYIWHQPLLRRIPGWLDRDPSQVPFLLELGLGFALAVAVAAASWHLLESPLQRRLRNLV
jgi:peptidoglycan/LPS O-acetylase OafA/YrhL